MKTSKVTKTNPLGLTIEDIEPYFGIYGYETEYSPNWKAPRGTVDLAMEICDCDKELKCMTEGGWEWEYPTSEFLKDDVRVSPDGFFYPIDCDEKSQIKNYGDVRRKMEKVAKVSAVLADPRLLLSRFAIEVFAIRQKASGNRKHVKVSDEAWNRIKAWIKPQEYSHTSRQYIHDPWVTMKGEAIVWEDKMDNSTLVFHKDTLDIHYDYPMDYWD